MHYTRGRLLKDGGEGYIYEVQENPNLLMKIYKEADLSGAPIVTPELRSKLEYMKNNPPDALVSQGIIAWPLELIKDSYDNLLGFVMPRLNMDEHILRVYSYRHPQMDQSEYGKFPSIRSRVSIAINLCSALHELHRKGYVVGDFNHENIGVNYSTGQIYIMDCDSFHIVNEYGAVFRTNVIMAGYLAPEIIIHCNEARASGRPFNLDNVSLPTFTVYSDRFCLAIHIFKLLMNGVDPFRGIKSEATGSTASPFVGNMAIERDAYVFRPGNRPSAVFCPPQESLPPEILTLFNEAFIDGRANPLMRPDEAAWYNALMRYLSYELVQCPVNEKHQHYSLLRRCPYCAADVQHEKAQGGFVRSIYRESPEEVMTSSALDIISRSRRRRRMLHLVISLILWGGAAIAYFVWNYLAGNRTFVINPAEWSGFEVLFAYAAIIEFCIEEILCRIELSVLNATIDMREVDPKYYDNDLRKYQKKLVAKVMIMSVFAVVFAVGVPFVSFWLASTYDLENVAAAAGIGLVGLLGLLIVLLAVSRRFSVYVRK